MKILNLGVDDLHLNSVYNEDGLRLKLGTKEEGYPNEVILSNIGLDFSNELNLGCFFSLNHLDDGTPILTEMSKAKRGSFKKAPNTHNFLFTGVLSLDGSTLADNVKVWGTGYLLSTVKLLAYGMRNNSNNDSSPYALLHINDNCDYEINGVLYSGRTGNTICKSKKKHCYTIESIIQKCLSNEHDIKPVVNQN